MKKGTKVTKKKITEIKELPVIKEEKEQENELNFKNKVSDLKKVDANLINDLNVLVKHFHELIKKQGEKHNINLSTQIFFEIK
jgi:hypothetical protein